MTYTLKKKRVRRPAPFRMSVFPAALVVSGSVTPATSRAVAGLV